MLLALLYSLTLKLIPLAALPDPKSAESMGWLMGTMAACAVVGNQILGAVANFRKLKGSDPHADNRYVSKAEHIALSNTVAVIQGQITALNGTVQNELREINRSLGRLEGAAGTAPKQVD